MKMNEIRRKMNGNEKTKLNLQKKCTLRDNLNTYDPPPLGEVFFFAAGPFFKRPVFSAPAFAFGCVLLREPSSSSLSPSSAFALPFTLEWWLIDLSWLKASAKSKVDSVRVPRWSAHYSYLCCSSLMLSKSIPPRWKSDSTDLYRTVW